MSRELSEVVNLPVNTANARLDTLSSGLPEGAEVDGLDRFVEAAQYILQNIAHLKENAVGVHLLGKPGTGKTFAAVALMRAIYTKLPESIQPEIVHVPSRESNRGTSLRCSDPLSSWSKAPFQIDNNLTGVVLLDDVQNDEKSRRWFFDATEAVNNSGGLLIVTSNVTDPMFYIDAPEKQKTAEEYMMEKFLDDHGVDRSTPIRDRNAQLELDRIYSRIAGTMLPIIFDTKGVDLRGQHGFWGNF